MSSKLVLKHILLKAFIAILFFFSTQTLAKSNNINTANKMSDSPSTANQADIQLDLDNVIHTTHTVLTQTNWWHVLHIMVRVLIILTVSYLFMRLIDKVIQTWGPRLSNARTVSAHSSLINTVLPIIRSVLRWIIGLMTLLVLLSELGVNITPLIYSLSVIGLAVSIGSQSLVKDFINGIMTLVEGSVAVGDEVYIGNYTGIVESMSLRYIYLKNETGALYTIPFSEVSSITNISRDYIKVPLSVTCTPEVSLDVVEHIFEKAYKDLKSDDDWHSILPLPINFQGVKSITNKGVEISAQIRVNHQHTKIVGYAFHNKILKLCQEKNVPIAFTPNEA